MKINQVEELVGITKKNIRFYEEQGLLRVERNPENGYRDYNLKDVDQLMKIKLLRKLNVPIEEIRKVQTGENSFHNCLEMQIVRLNHDRHSIDLMKQLCTDILQEEKELEKIDAPEYLSRMKQMEEGGTRFMDVQKNDIKKKKQGSGLAALVIILLLVGWLGLILWGTSQGGVPILVILAFVVVFGIVVTGILVALRQRLREINGGEEDEARKY